MAYIIYDNNAQRELKIATNLRYYITKNIDNGMTSKTELLTFIQTHYDDDDLQYGFTLLNMFSRCPIIHEDEYKEILQYMYQ